MGGGGPPPAFGGGAFYLVGLESRDAGAKSKKIKIFLKWGGPKTVCLAPRLNFPCDT